MLDHYPVKSRLLTINLTVDCGVLFELVCDKAEESAEQDQTARMCRLNLLYTLRKISTLLQQVD